MEFQENNSRGDRMEEFVLALSDLVRQTPRAWFIALAAILVGAIPLQMSLKLVFEQIIIRNAAPVEIIYQAVVKQPLSINEKKVFAMDNNTYAGYMKIKNPNSEWGVPEQRYTADFQTLSGASIKKVSGTTYVLPTADKIVVFPRFSSQDAPANIVVTLSESSFIRPQMFPPLNLEIERKSLDLQVNQSIISAVIVNKTPFNITEVDLPILLYDNANNVIGANYTNINDLASSESRSFQYTWFTRLNNVARYEILPEINIFNRGVFGSVPGTNPFDNRE